MKYVQLKKYFHINERECNEIYLKRFESESSHKLGISIHGYECFYMNNDEIINLIGQIYEINTWLEKTLRTENLPLPSHHYLILRSLIEEIRSSNRIEGIYSTRKEIQDMIMNEPPLKYKRFYGMVHKYAKLVQESHFQIQTSSDIRDLYDDILLDDILEENQKDYPDGIIFRKETVEINSGNKVLHKGIIGEKNIIEMMEHSLKILNDDSINFLIRIAIFHYLFEYIHPFYNGNGRMGRFIASGYLSNHLNTLSALQLSIACLHNTKTYYDAFEMTNDIRNKADLTIFIIHFLEIYLSGLKELQENIQMTMFTYQNIKKKIHSHVNEKHHELVEILLQSTLFGPSGLTMSELVELTSLTEQTLRRNIKEINQTHQIIKVNNRNKPYQYTIDIDNII